MEQAAEYIASQVVGAQRMPPAWRFHEMVVVLEQWIVEQRHPGRKHRDKREQGQHDGAGHRGPVPDVPFEDKDRPSGPASPNERQVRFCQLRGGAWCGHS